MTEQIVTRVSPTASTGVYKITNLWTGEAYIGSAVSFRARWALHVRQLVRNTHPNCHLQKSWNKYGDSLFCFEKIAACERHQLLQIEQFCIDLYEPEFNICRIAGSRLDTVASEVTKQKMSASRRKNKLNARAVILVELGSKFESCAAAARWLRSIGVPLAGHQKISKACTGKSKRVYGFTWQYEDGVAHVPVSNDYRKGTNSHRSKPVRCIDTGEEYPNARVAAEYIFDQKSVRNRRSAICSCCSGTRKTAYGLSWEYI